MAISGKRDTRALKPVSRRGEPVLKTRKNLWGRAPLTADRRRVALAYATYVPQASAGRSAHAAGAGPPRAARESRRACGLRLRPVVVGGVRDRGNSLGAHPGRQRRAQLLASRCPRHRRAAGHRRHLVPPDGRGIPAGWRCLPRRQGQPGHLPGADCGGSLAGRLRADGVEAVSNGVQALKPPEGRNAQTVMTWLGVLSIAMFLGITYLAYDFGIAPGGDETVVSKIARRVFGTGVPYYCVQSATLLILVLAANTSYADFPRLSSILARDRFVPRQFANQGDRLVFSNGIMILSGFAILLIVAFQGDTHALLPLYAIGVFISFTLSQGGMVRRWLRLRERGWRWRVWINGAGALGTGVVLLTLTVTKFVEGAWIVVVVIPVLVAMFVVMHRHYAEVARELSLEGLEGPPKFQHTVLVLIGDVHRGVVRAVQYARTLAPTAVVRAVYVETDPTRTARLEHKWGKWGLGGPLVVLTSPYRSLLRPLLDYLDHLQSYGDDQMVTIVLPEFLPRHWWQHALHNQTALLVKGALLFRENTVVADVPYLLRR